MLRCGAVPSWNDLGRADFDRTSKTFNGRSVYLPPTAHVFSAEDLTLGDNGSGDGGVYEKLLKVVAAWDSTLRPDIVDSETANKYYQPT